MWSQLSVMGFKRFSRLLLLIGGVSLSAASSAFSITAIRKHNPDRACTAVESVLSDISRKSLGLSPLISTEALGRVEYDERELFFTVMTSSEGKADLRPMKLTRLYRLSKNKFSPLYLAAVDRLVWHESRLEEDSNGGSERIVDPRHYIESSYWLVSFQSDTVIRMREALELRQLASESARSKGCGSG